MPYAPRLYLYATCLFAATLQLQLKAFEEALSTPLKSCIRAHGKRPAAPQRPKKGSRLSPIPEEDYEKRAHYNEKFRAPLVAQAERFLLIEDARDLSKQANNLLTGELRTVVKKLKGTRPDSDAVKEISGAYQKASDACKAIASLLGGPRPDQEKLAKDIGTLSEQLKTVAWRLNKLRFHNAERQQLVATLMSNIHTVRSKLNIWQLDASLEQLKVKGARLIQQQQDALEKALA